MIFDLFNGLGNKLVLTVSKVGSDIFRVVIEEPDLHRYHITHSLEREPITELVSQICSFNCNQYVLDLFYT